MPEDDVQNPGLGGGGEPTEPTEPTAPTEPAAPSGDPLDDIIDEKARAEAKRDRAIARRKAPPQAPAPAPSQPVYASANDLALIVTNQAKAMVSAEVQENWDELIKIELGGYNPKDAQSIAQNMSERLAIYRTRQQEKENPTKDLISTPGIRGSQGKAPAPTKSAIPRPMSVDEQAAKLYG